MSDLDHINRDVIDRDSGDSPEPGEEPGLVAPAKAVRLLSTLKGTLDELHRIPIDETTRLSLIASHQAALTEVASTVSDVLIDELVRLHMAPLEDDATADQIRVAQAQLLGWVIGLIQSGGLVDALPLPTTPPQTATGRSPAR
jgi:hypothetical protein